MVHISSFGGNMQTIANFAAKQAKTGSEHILQGVLCWNVYVCTYVRTYVCMYVCIERMVQVVLCWNKHVCMYVLVCMYLCVYVCMYVLSVFYKVNFADCI